MNYSLGIDLGTSYFKVGIFNENSNLKGLGRIPVEEDIADGTHCELPSERFIQLLTKGIQQACRQAEITPSRINRIGYSSQANSFLLLDSNLNPLTPLLLWPDIRFPNMHSKALELWNRSDFIETTGVGIELSSNFCVNKLLWLRSTQPKLWKKVKSVMTISDYLAYLFTGFKVGDLGTASLLGLLNCKNAKWWTKAFNILDLDVLLFSKRQPVGSKIEGCKGIVPENIGIKKNTTFYVGSVDHHMAAVGAGVGKTADMSESTGTVLACVNFSEHYCPQKGICISPWTKGRFARLAFDSNGAGSLEWYHKSFANELSFEELIETAMKVDSSHGLTAKPMAYQYQTKEQVFTGITPRHSHGHFVRALMESSALTLKELVNKIASGESPRMIVSTGGGAKSDLWLQIKSEIIGVPFTRTNQEEPACYGAIN